MEEQESSNEDVAIPEDIEKRFQHLVNEWSNFQQRAGFSVPKRESLFSNLVDEEECLNKVTLDDTESPPQSTVSSQLGNSDSDKNAQDLAQSEENSWSDLCQKLSDIEILPESLEEQGSADPLFQQREEQLRNSEKRLIEEQNKLSEAWNSLFKYEEALSVREKLVRKQEQAVAESQRAATASLVEFQKRTAEITVEDSVIQEKQQYLEDFEKQLGKAMHEMQKEKEALNKRKLECHEQDLQIRTREKAIESQLAQCEEEKAKVKAEWEKLGEERAMDSKERREYKEREERIEAKEKDVETKLLAVDSLVQKLDAREKLLKNIKKQCEEERTQIQDLMAKMDAENKSNEEAKKEMEISKNRLEEASKRFSKEQQQSAQDMKLADEKIKTLEERIKRQEHELMQKQTKVEMLEAQVKNEQHQNHILHSRIQIEQEKMMEEMAIQEENLKKRESILEKKEEDVKKSLQKLVEKRNLVDLKLKQLKEIETRTESLEDELHNRHQDHLQKVERHAKQYEAELEQLETTKHDLQQKSAELDRRFQEVQAMKKEAKQCQKKIEREFHDKMEVFLKDKANLETQKQSVINLQQEIEKAGNKLMDHMKDLDGPLAKLDMLHEKLEVSEKKLRILVNYISQQQKFLKEKEKTLIAKERQFEGLHKEWERKNGQFIAREEILNLQEQTLKSREENFNQLGLCLKEGNEQKHDSAVNSHHAMIEEMHGNCSNDAEFLNRQTIGQTCNLATGPRFERKENSKTESSAETLTIEMLQQEFARIIKERDNLKVQQLELEQTKNEVQDAKLTLAAQLRATKEMVVDASITAQRASREREALEQERRRLGNAQKEIEAILAAREAKLSLEERNLEKEKHFLEKEKEHALKTIYKAEHMKKLVDTVERNGNEATYPERLDLAKPMHGRAYNHPLSEQCSKLRQNLSTGVHHSKVPSGLEMISLWRDKECAKIEREEKMIMDEISRRHNQRQDEMKTSGIKNVSNEIEHRSFSDCRAGNDRYSLYPDNLHSSSEALELPCQESCNDFYGQVSDEQMDEFLYGGENTYLKDMKEHNDSMYTNYEAYEDVTSNRTRLESMMQSLLNAREVSRSRLQRANNLIQALPSGGCMVSDVQQALDTLTDRLIMMEQMEEELTNELKEAYRAVRPDSEVILVDKVELLCKMEEQQTLRAEWEKDMQSQLEKISINSQSSSCFSTPIKRTVFDRLVSPPSNHKHPNS